MNQIFNLIVRIFQAIFEQDYERRAGEPYQKKDAHGRTASDSESGGGQTLSLEDFLDRVIAGRPEGQTSAQAGQTSQPSQTSTPQQRTAPTRTPRPRAGAGHQRGTGYKSRIRTSRNLQQTAPLSGTDMPSFDKRAKPMKVKHTKKRRMGHFDLPGDSTLEQLIYANVILGPCKAHRHRKSPRQNV